MTYEEELIENLRNINHLTGNKNIIDICNKAATYIYSAERFKFAIEKECTAFSEWTERLKVFER